MLARAPGDVARANAAQPKRSPSPGRTPHPARGNGAVCPATRGANAHGGPANARGGQRVDQPAARRGMRCAAGQLTERRTDCAADSAHIWSTWSASMVDHSDRTRSVRRASRSQISQRSRKDRPITGSTLCGSNRGHHRPSRFGIAVRPGAPQGPVCAVPATPSGIDRVAAEVAQNWFGTPQPDRADGPPPNRIIVIRRLRPAGRGCRRWRPGRHR